MDQYIDRWGRDLDAIENVRSALNEQARHLTGGILRRIRDGLGETLEAIGMDPADHNDIPETLHEEFAEAMDDALHHDRFRSVLDQELMLPDGIDLDAEHAKDIKREVIDVWCKLLRVPDRPEPATRYREVLCVEDKAGNAAVYANGILVAEGPIMTGKDIAKGCGGVPCLVTFEEVDLPKEEFWPETLEALRGLVGK